MEKGWYMWKEKRMIVGKNYKNWKIMSSSSKTFVKASAKPVESLAKKETKSLGRALEKEAKKVSASVLRNFKAASVFCPDFKIFHQRCKGSLLGKFKQKMEYYKIISFCNSRTD